MKTKLLRKIRRRYRYQWTYTRVYDCWMPKWCIADRKNISGSKVSYHSTHDAVTYMATNVLKRSWLDRIIGV